MNRDTLDRAVSRLLHASDDEPVAYIRRPLATVLDALAEYQRTVTTGGPTRDPDLDWGNETLPAPPSASDPHAPTHRRGSNRTAPR